MKKIGLMVAMAVCALTAWSVDYPYLVFTNTEGTTTAFSVSNLTMTVSGTELQVTNDDGTVSFKLAELSAMQFSSTETLTALENVLKADEPVKVLTLTGMEIGSFDSLLDAARSLEKGVYVLTNGKNTQKIIIQ